MLFLGFAVMFKNTWILCSPFYMLVLKLEYKKRLDPTFFLSIMKVYLTNKELTGTSHTRYELQRSAG